MVAAGFCYLNDAKPKCGLLNRVAAALARADANAVIHRQNKNLSIADLAVLASPATFDDRINRWLDKVVVHRDLQLHFAKQIHLVFVTTIELGLSLLPAKALAIEHRQAEYLNFGKGRFDFFQLAGLDDGNDELHGRVKIVSKGPKRERPFSLTDFLPLAVG